MDGTHDALRERYQGRQHSHRHSQGMGKTNLIIVYTVIVCLSCLYLETQVSLSLVSTSNTFWEIVELATWRG
jgi:hypothetical protein